MEIPEGEAAAGDANGEAQTDEPGQGDDLCAARKSHLVVSLIVENTILPQP
jgi:hypothetical protein